MNKRTLLASAALLTSFVLPAAAADMPVKAPPRAPVAAAIYNWTGFYIGAHVGYGHGEVESTAVTATGSFPTGFVFATNEPSGLLAGGQVGFNWQTGSLVLGIEAQGSWTDMDDTTRSLSPTITGNFVDTLREIEWILTVAGRLGFAVNNWLLYAKGGWAWADFSSHSETRNAANTLLAITTGSGRRDGWMAGAGAELGIAPNWSFKVEYNFIDFGTERVAATSTTVATGAVTTLLRDVDAHVHIAKVGINYRFGGAAPVVARY